MQTIWFSLPIVSTVVARYIPLSVEKKLGQAVVNTIGHLFSDFGEEPQWCEGKARDHIKELAERLNTSDYDIEVYILDTDEMNALATPGGNIVILRGFLEDVESGDEVAAVLAHELAHISHRHTTESLVKSIGLSVLFQFMGSGIGDLGRSAIEFSYTRDGEREADDTAVKSLNDNGLKIRRSCHNI